MTENMLLRAVLDDLKGRLAPGFDVEQEKVRAGRDCARRPGGPPRDHRFLEDIEELLWEYWRARLSRPTVRALRGRVRSCSRRAAATGATARYGRACAARGGARPRRSCAGLMREEGLEVVYNRRRRRGWSSYEGGLGGPAEPGGQGLLGGGPRRAVGHRRHRVPRARRQGLPERRGGLHDGRPAGWRIGPRPTASLANGSLLDALAARREGAHRGAQRPRGHYRWPGWIAICGEHGLARSMSAKGVQPRQRGLRGVLREAQERVLPLPGLGGRLARGVLRDAGRYLRYYCSGGSSARSGG